jgi:hypothetical protein
MKIIITEDQNALLRRFGKIKDEVYIEMDGRDPCFYAAHQNFDKFVRDVLRNAINEVLYHDNNITVDPRIWTDFRNELVYVLGDMIKSHYNKIINEQCPNVYEDNNKRKPE